jgi:predicted  nucleic acid-binding Zn-ribbon protein
MTTISFCEGRSKWEEDMSKICAWCGAVLRIGVGLGIVPTSHALCQGCHEELQTALSTNGLRPGDGKPRPH